jgi:hypothetical protein
LGYGLNCRCCFPEVPGRRCNPISRDDFRPSSHSGRRRNVDLLPIGYGSRPRLRGPANPARINLAQEPLDFRREGFSPSSALLMSAFALPIPPHPLARGASPAYGTLRYHVRRQGSGIRDQNCGGRGPAACGRSPDIRPASAQRYRLRYSRGRGHRESRPASHRPNRLPSSQNDGTRSATDATCQTLWQCWHRSILTLAGSDRRGQTAQSSGIRGSHEALPATADSPAETPRDPRTRRAHSLISDP